MATLAVPSLPKKFSCPFILKFVNLISHLSFLVGKHSRYLKVIQNAILSACINENIFLISQIKSVGHLVFTKPSVDRWERQYVVCTSSRLLDTAKFLSTTVVPTNAPPTCMSVPVSSHPCQLLLFSATSWLLVNWSIFSYAYQPFILPLMWTINIFFNWIDYHFLIKLWDSFLYRVQISSSDFFFFLYSWYPFSHRSFSF